MQGSKVSIHKACYFHFTYCITLKLPKNVNKKRRLCFIIDNKYNYYYYYGCTCIYYGCTCIYYGCTCIYYLMVVSGDCSVGWEAMLVITH